MTHRRPVGIVGRRGRPAIGLCLLLTVLSAGNAWADKQRYKDVTVTSLPLVGDRTTHGYVAYRFEITNHSFERPHRVTLTLPADLYGRSFMAGISRTVTVAADSTAAVSLFQPPLPISGRSVGVRIDGRSQDRPLRVDPINHGEETARYSRRYSSSDSTARALASRAFRNTNLESVLSPKGVQLAVSENPPALWSGDWLAYSRFDGVIVTAEEMAAMSAAARQALVQYSECGGALMVVGSWEPPETWTPTGQPAEGLVAYQGGFGVCMVMAAQQGPGWDVFARRVVTASGPWSQMHTPAEAHRAFPVVKNIRVPIRGMLTLMLVFVILIGPVNMLVLRRGNRRIWLLWTVPAFSLLTCGIVFGYSILSEGFRGSWRLQAMTVLDETTHRATSIGWMGFYSPLTPAGGLRSSYETELTPQLRQDDWRSRARGSRTIDWTNGQHLASGWVQARVPAYFKFRKSEARRQRLAIETDDDGRIVVVNGLGADISRLHLADAAGRIHVGGAIPAGAKAILGPTDKRVDGTKALATVYIQRWPQSIKQISDRPAAFLRPGTYLAELVDSPFVETPLKGARATKFQVIVYGISGKAGHGN